MHIKPFQASFPRLEYITSNDSFFNSVKEEYRDYYESGFFQQAEEQALYVYQIKSKEQTFTGLIACTEIRDYLEGHILKHEKTLAEKEQKQIQLILKRRAAVKPVMLTYPEVTEIENWLQSIVESQAPFLVFDFKYDQHILWKIKDISQTEQIVKLFEEQVSDVFIADGHHRTSSVAALYQRGIKHHPGEDYSMLLSAFFSNRQLQVQAFNRVIDGLHETTLTTFMARLSQLFDIAVLDKPNLPSRKQEIIMFVNREWFCLRWKIRVLEEQKGAENLIDTALLNELVLGPILNIGDVRTDLRIEYVEAPKGINGIQKRTLASDYHVGFILFPIDLEDLFTIVQTGHVLPPKSTYFEPRMKNGLIVKDF